ncbi:MAG: O-antigen ligase family protein [Firmicutes bacterium]|nr:O-antigen ligase family protein [Bacillota bacterium]
MNILENSRVYRFLAGIWLTLYRSWDHSLLGAISRGLSESYETSLSARLWNGFCSVENPGPSSAWARLWSRIRSFWESMGEILSHSLFYRIVIWFRDLYLKLTETSLVFRQINRLSLHQWVLVVFAAYLPMEYVIRDLLGLSLLASAWEELFILGTMVLLLWRIGLKQTNTIDRSTPVGSLILLFMAVGFLLMNLIQPNPSIAMAGLRAQVEYMVWFFLILHLIEDDRDFRILYGAFAAVVFLLSLHGIYQYIIAVPIPAGWVSQTEVGVRTRVFSLTGSPNIFGSLLVMGAPMVASLMYYCKKPWAKILALCATGAMCLCLLFTFSKGAWLGIVLAVILFSLFLDKRLLAVMGAAIAAVLVLVPSVTNRITYLFTSDYAQASAVGGRSLRWETGWNLLHDNNPWLGFGLGRFGGAVAMNNQILDKTEEFSYFYMDNYYLKTMVEMGYIGIIFFIILLAGLLIWGIRAIYQSDYGFVRDKKLDPLFRNAGNIKVLAVGIYAGLMGVLLHCYFENIFEEPYMMAYFWGLAATLMYAGFFRKNAKKV